MKSIVAVLLLASSFAHADHVVKCVEPGNEQDVLSLAFNASNDVLSASYLLGSYEGRPEYEASALVLPLTNGDRVAQVGVFHSEVTYLLPAALFDPANDGVDVPTSFVSGTAVLPAICRASY